MNAEIPAPSLFADEGFRRKFGWSFGAHVVLAALLWFAPDPRFILPEPTPVYIDVVVSAPEPAPPPPAAKPVKKQVVDEVVIPKEPPKAKPKPEPVPKVEKKPVPKPEPKPKAKQPPPPSAEDVLAKLRQKVESRPGAKPGVATTGARRGIFDPEKAAYQKKLTNLLYANWAGAGICRQDPKPSDFRIELDAGGALRSLRMTRSSGNRFCDESAERAIRKVDPLPAPPRGIDVVTITFDPLELR